MAGKIKAKSKPFGFSHLFSGRAAADAGYQEQNRSQRLDKEEPGDVKTAIPSQHSREHNVAVSAEAKDSPVLAVQLLRTTALKSREIKKRLSTEPEGLSAYTVKFMEDNVPGWEFQDANEQAFSASVFSANNNDRNGYMASRGRAVQTLKKMEEPLTEDEVAAVTEKTRRIMNMMNPNTPDNIAARQQADEQYQEQIAQAVVARNNKLRSTGLTLPGDARRADGTPVGPTDEAESVKRSLALQPSSSVR